MVKDYILQEVSNTWESKLMQILVANVKLMIFLLNRDNALLFQIKKYVSPKILTFIYFAIFQSHLSCSSLVWAQNCITIQRIVILQKSFYNH